MALQISQVIYISFTCDQALMGCTSSQAQTANFLINKKPQLWFILGGPGSKKAKIIEYLIRDYKYFYLSIFQMLQFEKERNSPDSQLIKKCIMDKKTFSSQLITRLLKKVIASLGVRRYLIDGYPRNKQDIEQFQKQPFLRQITLQKFIHIKVSRQKMKLTGIQAKKNEKNPPQQVEKQVESVIEEYKKNEEQILQICKGNNSLITIPQRQSQDETYNELRLQLQNLNNFRSINQGDTRVFFASFDVTQDQSTYTYQITQKYGFHCYDYLRLLQQCKLKNNSQSKYIQESQTKKEPLSSDFVLHLVRKKIQKKDYIGNFFISGFPRNINDAQQWNKNFGWEVTVHGFLNFCAPETKLQNYLQNSIQKQTPGEKEQNHLSPLDQYNKNKKLLQDFYSKQSNAWKIDCQNQFEATKLIQAIMIEKGISRRKRQSTIKLIFMSTISEQGPLKLDPNHLLGMKDINMMYCYENQIKENNLYSELIQSYMATGRPLPGDVAVKVLLNKLSQLNLNHKESPPQTVLIKGFPNSVQQLIAWNQEIGNSYQPPILLYFTTTEQKIKQKLTKSKAQFTPQTIQQINKNSLQFQQYLKSHQIKSLKILQNTSPQQIYNYIT